MMRSLYFHQNIQTLNILSLYDNELGAVGAKSMADALKVNQVRLTAACAVKVAFSSRYADTQQSQSKYQPSG